MGATIYFIHHSYELASHRFEFGPPCITEKDKGDRIEVTLTTTAKITKTKSKQC